MTLSSDLRIGFYNIGPERGRFEPEPNYFRFLPSPLAINLQCKLSKTRKQQEATIRQELKVHSGIGLQDFSQRKGLGRLSPTAS